MLLFSFCSCHWLLPWLLPFLLGALLGWLLNRGKKETVVEEKIVYKDKIVYQDKIIYKDAPSSGADIKLSAAAGGASITTSGDDSSSSASDIEAGGVSVVTSDDDKDKEDDYLASKDYEGREVNDKKNNVALFKHTDGQYYFALYNADGSVKLRSEGFKTSQERDQELSGVLRFHDNPSMYKTLTRGKYSMDVLYDETGREVGRSGLKKKGDKQASTTKMGVADIGAGGSGSGGSGVDGSGGGSGAGGSGAGGSGAGGSGAGGSGAGGSGAGGSGAGGSGAGGSGAGGSGAGGSGAGGSGDKKNVFAALKNDNLQIVEGIGPKMNEVLNKHGVKTWAELASNSPEGLRAILDKENPTRYRIIDPTTWPEQARLANAGEWDDLITYQKRLDTGRTDVGAGATDAKVEKLLVKMGVLKKWKQDDLKAVEGIGPKIAGLLHDAGIKTWKALSETSVDAIQAILDKAGSRYKLADPGTWPKQAEMAAKGDWDALKEYQDFLQGGK